DLTNFVVFFTLQELASMSGGELIGDPKLNITGAASLAEASSGEISFFANRKYIGLLRKTRASAVFVPPDFAEPLPLAQVRVSNPTKAFDRLCSNSHRNRSPLLQAFIRARLSDQAFASENVYQSSLMRSSKAVPKSAMNQLLALEVTLDMKQQSGRRA